MIFKRFSNPGIYSVLFFVCFIQQMFAVCVLAGCCGEYRDG